MKKKNCQLVTDNTTITANDTELDRYYRTTGLKHNTGDEYTKLVSSSYYVYKMGKHAFSTARKFRLFYMVC